MIPIGIESINVFGGTAYLDVLELAKHRNLDISRFNNLLMKEKAVPLPFEDAVTFGVNAAKPILDNLTDEEVSKIELLITCTESGVDFGKSLSTYIHDYLKLNRNCRMFELKNACYSGTAGLQMAINFILSQTSPGAKALVVATDIARFMAEDGDDLTSDWSYAEPSGGAGAVALLVSDNPKVFQIDVGANGYYGYEVMDTCRPTPDGEAGDADLSLLSYLDCCEQSFIEYRKRVTNVDYKKTFQYLAFHTPFGGMVKGAHRTMMRKMTQDNNSEIEDDFVERVLPGMTYCQRVGNIMGATALLSLASTIDNCKLESPKRVGCFSYGSGCCSEFYSGVITPSGQVEQKQYKIEEKLNNRYRLSMAEYDVILRESTAVRFGTKNVELNLQMLPAVFESCHGKGRLYLEKIKEFHREYRWL